MTSTGNTYPGTGENVNRVSNPWTNPGDIVSDNATDATVIDVSDYLVARNFGFSIGADQQIDGITVRVEASEHAFGTAGMSAQLQDASGTLIGAVKTFTVSGTTKVIHTLGGSADLWSATLDYATINDADFGVRIWQSSGVTDVRVDFVTVSVDYSLAPTARPRILRAPGLL